MGRGLPDKEQLHLRVTDPHEGPTGESAVVLGRRGRTTVCLRHSPLLSSGSPGVGRFYAVEVEAPTPTACARPLGPPTASRVLLRGDPRAASVENQGPELHLRAALSEPGLQAPLGGRCSLHQLTHKGLTSALSAPLGWQGSRGARWVVWMSLRGSVQWVPHSPRAHLY